MRESVMAQAREALLGRQGEEAPRFCDQTPALLLQGMVSACTRAGGRAGVCAPGPGLCPEAMSIGAALALCCCVFQGGSGKTVAAVALAKDRQIRSHFERILCVRAAVLRVPSAGRL